MRFEERDLKALQFDYPREAFERVRQVSEINDRLYQTFVSPWVRATVNPWTAEVLKWLHPMRLSRYLFSESFSPWMYSIAVLGEVISKNRAPLRQDHPFLEQERRAVARASEGIEQATHLRDSAEEQIFSLSYGH